MDVDTIILFFFHFSSKKKELTKQHKVEHSPNRTQQPEPKPTGSSAPTNQNREKQQGTASPPLLDRPLSIPADAKVGHDDRSSSPSKSSTLQRYKDTGGIKEKGEKWKERYSDVDPRDESSPEKLKGRDDRKDVYGFILFVWD